MPALKRKSSRDLTERGSADFKRSRVVSTTWDVEPTSSPVVNENADRNQIREEVEINIPVDNEREVQRLKKELQEMKERITRLEEESNHKLATISRIREVVQCAICRGSMRNPYTLECGHSSCYRCLRRWWLTSSSSSNSYSDIQPELLTDDGSGDSDDGLASQVGASQTILSSNAPSRRHPIRFKSIAHLHKQCPECRKVVSPWNRPALNYRLRDVVDALRPTPLPSMEQIRSNKRRGQRHDAWRGIFPSYDGADTDGSAIRRNRQTLQAQHAFYIPPWHTQGQIETPPDLSSSFPFHLRHQVEEHRAQRRAQPYRAADPQRRERRRFERYDPVREAHSEMEERERQARARARIPSPNPPAVSYPPPLESSPDERSLGQTLRTASSGPQTVHASLAHPLQPQALEPEVRAVEAVHTLIHLPPLQQQTSSQSHLQLPSIRDILSHPWSSTSAIRDPLLTSQFLQSMRLQIRPRTPPIDEPLRFDSNGGFLVENDAEEVSSANSCDDGDGDVDADGSDVSQPAANADAWIGADLED